MCTPPQSELRPKSAGLFPAQGLDPLSTHNWFFVWVKWSYQSCTTFSGILWSSGVWTRNKLAEKQGLSHSVIFVVLFPFSSSRLAFKPDPKQHAMCEWLRNSCMNAPQKFENRESMSCRRSHSSPSPVYLSHTIHRGCLRHHRWLHNQFPPFFSVLHYPLGHGELQACPFFDVVFPLLLALPRFKCPVFMNHATLWSYISVSEWKIFVCM